MPDPSPTPETLGQRVQRLRLAQGLTVPQLAARLTPRCSIQTIHSIEQGHSSPRIDTLQRLAAALGVSVADLLG